MQATDVQVLEVFLGEEEAAEVVLEWALNEPTQKMTLLPHEYYLVCFE